MNHPNRFFWTCSSLIASIFFSGNAVFADVIKFGHSDAGGPSANIPRVYGRAIGTCVDGASDDTRCDARSRFKISDQFCKNKGYKGVARDSDGFARVEYRRSTNAQPIAVYSLLSEDFIVRDSFGKPTFFLVIYCNK